MSRIIVLVTLMSGVAASISGITKYIQILRVIQYAVRDAILGDLMLGGERVLAACVLGLAASDTSVKIVVFKYTKLHGVARRLLESYLAQPTQTPLSSTLYFID